MAKQNETEKKSTLVLTGTLKQFFFGKSKFSDIDMYRLCIECENVPYEDIYAYDDCGDKLTPKWLKEKSNKLNFKSKFDFPIQAVDGKKLSCDDFIEMDKTVDAQVKLKIRQKEGAIYPVAMSIVKNGTEYNPFFDM